MKEYGSYVSRAKMSPRERHLRSQLTKLLSAHAITKGSLLYRKSMCGKAGCKCAQGEGHAVLCLVVREKGKQRQIFIPQDWHDKVKTWVAGYQKVKELQEELCQLYWERLQKREV